MAPQARFLTSLSALFIPLVLLGVAFMALFGGIQQMTPTEYGVRFRKLPPWFGGGLSDEVIRPGETVVVMPWESVYRFDTRPRDVSWGRGSDRGRDDFVYTRAADGNEVALAFTVRYRISPEAGKMKLLLDSTAGSDEQIRAIVSSVGRSHIRRYMNELLTADFLKTTARYDAVDRVRKAMEEKLTPLGLEVVQVNLDDYRFERKLKDETTDSSYQARLTEIQQLTEDTARERLRQETVKAQKEQERRQIEANNAQLQAEAEGYLNQATVRGDGYLAAKTNEADGILARGRAEVEGIVQQLAAFDGPGGSALLKLGLARELLKGDPRFVVLDNGGSGGAGVAVNKLNTNELIQQLGLLEGMIDQPKVPAPSSGGVATPKVKPPVVEENPGSVVEERNNRRGE